MHPVEVTDEEVRALTQSVLMRYGIDFTCYELNSLKRRISRVLSIFNFTSIHELWVKLLRDHAFIHSFMNEISVGMTSMFRDPVLWKALKDELTSRFRGPETIHLWHAGCSTGEEVYSMSILLKEIDLLSKTTAWATDINQDAMQVARQGAYHKIKMIENEKNYRAYNASGCFNSYYKKTDGKNAVMDPRLIDNVTFGYHNLVNDVMLGAYDVIFCRNVMIYFDTVARTKLMEKFYDALKPGGYFVIGFYDAILPDVGKKNLTLVSGENRIFRKL